MTPYNKQTKVYRIRGFTGEDIDCVSTYGIDKAEDEYIFNPDTDAWLDVIIVEPEFRGNKRGKTILKEFEQFAKDENKRRVVCIISADDAEMQPNFEKWFFDQKYTIHKSKKYGEVFAYKDL